LNREWNSRIRTTVVENRTRRSVPGAAERISSPACLVLVRQGEDGRSLGGYVSNTYRETSMPAATHSISLNIVWARLNDSVLNSPRRNPPTIRLDPARLGDLPFSS